MPTAKDQRPVTVRLICLNPPPQPGDDPVLFGVQTKDKVLEVGAAQPTGAIHFTFPIIVRQIDDGTLRFSGPYAHGTTADPFVYLGLAPVAQPTSWIRRWKIGLASISWDDVRAVAEQDGAMLEGTLDELKVTRPPLVDGGWKLVVR